MRRLIGTALVTAWVGTLAAQPLRRFSFERPLMGTRVIITVWSDDSLRAALGAVAALDRIDSLEARLSSYRAHSEVSALSLHAGSGAALAVSQDLWVVLEAAYHMAERTNGAFDPTIGPLTRLWRWAARRDRLPPEEDVEAARKRVGYQMLKLDAVARTATLTQEGMRLDLGGIAKGYAADEALAVLVAHGLPQAAVDAGGDIALGIAPPAAGAWEVSLGPLGEAPLAGCGVATSGATYRFIEYEGVRYSHILDPRTGVSVTHHHVTTAIAPSAMEADAWASAASVMQSGDLKAFAAQEGAQYCTQAAPAQHAADCLASCEQGGIGIIVW